MKTTFYKTFPLFITLILWTACANPVKLVEKKKYDKAIDKLVKKFIKSGKRDAEEVKALETAYSEATNKDLTMIQYLKDEQREENWVRITTFYKQIKARQDKIQRVTPLVDENGRKAIFNFVNVDAELNESNEKSAKYHYDQAKKLLDEATASNDRFKARQAYNEFIKIEQYKPEYLDSPTLKLDAKEKGLTNVLLLVVDNTGKNVVDNQFLNTVFSQNFQDSAWVRHANNTNNGWNYHVDVTVQFDQALVTPNATDTRQYTDTKMVEDGVEYIRDQNGELVLDENGDPTTKPKFVEVSCVVSETRHHKTATVTGVFKIVERNGNKTIHSANLVSEEVFQVYTAGIISGDPRAASDETVIKTKNRTPAFPDDASLLNSAAHKNIATIQETYRVQRSGIQ